MGGGVGGWVDLGGNFYKHTCFKNFQYFITGIVF